MKTCRVIFSFAFLFLLVSAVSFAETIYLRDGRVIKGKILSKGTDSIVVQEGTLPRKYFNGLVERIEDDVDVISMDIDPLGISQEKSKLTLAMIKASGVYDTMEKNIEQVLVKIPEEYREEYGGLFNTDEIIERLIPIYDRYYSEEDLEKIIEFYESPIGQKVLEVTPKVIKESVGVSIQYFKEKADLEGSLP